MEKFKALESSEWAEIDSPDHFVRMENIYEDGSSIVVGRAVTVVDASLEETAAWELSKWPLLIMILTGRGGLL